MKDWQKNMIQLKEKLLPLATVDCYMRKWKKIVSTSQRISLNMLFLYKLASTYISDGSITREKFQQKKTVSSS